MNSIETKIISGAQSVHTTCSLVRNNTTLWVVKEIFKNLKATGVILENIK